MNKNRAIKYSTEYLAHTHETLRRAFKGAPLEEKVFVDSVLESIKQDVEQLEILQETLTLQRDIKEKITTKNIEK